MVSFRNAKYTDETDATLFLAISQMYKAWVFIDRKLINPLLKNFYVAADLKFFNSFFPTKSSNASRKIIPPFFGQIFKQFDSY